MKKGEQRIWQPALSHGDFRGEPDYLERRDTAASDFGAYHYVAVDIKNVERVNPGHRSQAGLYAVLLEHAQGRAPDEGYVSTVPFAAVLAMDTKECRSAFQEATLEIRASRNGEALAPYVSSGCKQSPWFADCVALAEQNDDLALLNNVRESTMRKLRKRGYSTLTDVAGMAVPEVARDSGLPAEVLERHQLQARCLRSGEHLFRERPELPVADTEVYFDVEGDPLRIKEYLFGVATRTSPSGPLEYEKFLATMPAGEKAMWNRFLKWLGKLPEGTLAVYHFGSYEISRLSLLGQKYGGSPALDRFRASMIDLAEVVKGCVVLPLYFYSLKDIGRYVGFDRGAAIAAGGESVSWYEAWLASKDRKKLDTIVDYNKDDVLATAALKDWLARGA
jgi:uncharacterized protein